MISNLLKKLSYLLKKIDKSRKASFIFQTSFTQEQITEAYKSNVTDYSIFLHSKHWYKNGYESGIWGDTISLHRVAGYRQYVWIECGLLSNGSGTLIYATATSWFFYIKWVLTIVFSLLSIVVTYVTLRSANFSLFVLALYLIPMFAYIIPTRLFEYECYEAKCFIEKTFNAKEIIGTET